jgi:hypothetical protein
MAPSTHTVPIDSHLLEDFSMTTTVRALFGAVLVLAGRPLIAPAQTGPAPAGRVPVVVAVTDSANFGQDVVILRRPDAVVPNLILMSRAVATPERLAAAAATMFAIMQRDGDRPTTRALYRVSTGMTGASRDIPGARRALGQLRAANAGAIDVTGAAVVQTTRIYLPDQASRARRRSGGKMRLRSDRRTSGRG